MDLKVELLRQSFDRIKPHKDAFASTFYENLFTDNPEAKPLFVNTDMTKQKKMLLASLLLIMENLRQPDMLADSLKQLGSRHVQYGTLGEHYPLVGAALLKTFESYLGSDWTPEVKEAWEDAYEKITELMLAGASSAPEA